MFYPLDKKPKGLILHMNGSAQVLQDSKSVCLANSGYMVLELGYGLKQVFIAKVVDDSTPYGNIKLNIQLIK